MTNEERDIQRKLRVLQHAEKIVNARKACRYFGIGRSSFLSLGADILNVSLPAPCLKPVVGKANSRPGEACTFGRVSLNRQQHLTCCDPSVQSIFDLRKASSFVAKAIRWIGNQDLLSL